MTTDYFLGFSSIGVFLLVGILFAVIGFTLSGLLRPKVINPAKYTTYECGEKPVGPALVQFSFRFYLIALAFIIFDVEAIFLFPWAVVFHEMKAVAFVEMGIFIIILLFGLAYIWRNGDLNWVKQIIPGDEDTF